MGTASETLRHNAPRIPENLWGYGKRIRFVDGAMLHRFPEHSRSQLSVLDVGCGNGSQLAIPLAESGYRVTGVDPHGPSIGRGRGLNSVVQFVHGELSDVPIQPFHCVIISEVLEHLHHPEELLSAALTYMSPGGILIVTVPNGYGEFEIDRRAFQALHLTPLYEALSDFGRMLLRKKRSCGISGSDEESPHVQRFTLGKLRRLFRGCGLTEVDHRATSLASGPFIAYTFGRLPAFISLNTSLADRLPFALAAGWMFVLERR